MQKLFAVVAFSILSSAGLLADHSPEIVNGGAYPCGYVAYTRVGWLNIMLRETPSCGDTNLILSSVVPNINNDYGNTIVFATNINTACGTAPPANSHFTYGIWNTRKGWGGWYFSNYGINSLPINVPDQFAGGLCQDSNDIFATAYTYSGGMFTNITAWLAYWRPGWDKIIINSVQLSTGLYNSQYIYCPQLLARGVSNGNGLHFGFVNGNLEVYANGWGNALWYQGNSETTGPITILTY